MEELAQSSTPDQLDDLIGRVLTYNPQADLALIRRAYDYSARMHGEQKRESGEPYVTHPLNVALIIAQLKLDVPSIVTGLLHDVVEDTGTSLAEVQSDFGRRGRAAGRRRHQGFEDHVPEPRGKAGREFPQDDHRDGAGHPRRADQARRPPAQHAHARSSRGGAPAGDLARDDGNLRADRASPRHLLAQIGARGPGFPLPQSSAY